MPEVVQRRPERLCAHPDSSTAARNRPRVPQRVEALEPRSLLAGDPVGPEFRVNTFDADGQSQPAIAADADGDFVIAWASAGQDGSFQGVYAQRYTAAGAAVGGEFRVNTTTAGGQSFPAVAMDSDGDFVVVWESSSQDGSAQGIYGQRYAANGTPVGGEFLVNTVTNGNQTLASVAMDAAGDFVVVWQSNGHGALTDDIYGQRYTADGAAAGGEFRVNTFTGEYQTLAEVAMDAGGNFVVAWMSNGQDGSSAGVYAQRYTAAGAPAGGEFRVNSYTPGGQQEPAVAAEADGDFVIAWQSAPQDGSSTGVYAQRYTRAGDAVGGEFRVNTTTESSQSDPAVAVDAAGNFVVAWFSFGQEAGAGIYAQRFTASGDRAGEEFRVNTFTAGNQLAAAAAMDHQGDFVIAWQSDGQDASGSGVYAQRYGLPDPRPAVAAGEFVYYSGAPHRLRLTFTQDVRASLAAADLTVERLGPGGGPVTLGEPTFDGAHTATFAFTGGGARPGILPDGNYRATLPAARVANAAGTPLAADLVLEFFVLSGDINRDRRVDSADFVTLAANFGRTGRTYAQGDLNGDGTVNSPDFVILAANFGKAVPAPAPAAAARPRRAR